MADRDRLTLHERTLHAIEESTNNEKLHDTVAQLARRFGQTAYAEIIHVLTSLEMSPHDAKVLWDAVWQYTETLSTRLARPVNLPMALHDYVTSVKHYIRHPKVMEVRSYEQMARAAIRDGLTGLYNTGYIREQVTWEVQKGKRYGGGGAIILFDLDSFKQCNDQYGHLAGDAVLRTFAACLLQYTRGTDVVGRYGGEEFLALLPSTTRSDALVVAERIRRAFAVTATQMPSGPPEGIQITTSGGIAEYRGGDTRTPEHLIEAADQALYLAKREGKNRVYLDLLYQDEVSPIPADMIQSIRPVEWASGAPKKTIGHHRFQVAVSIPVTVDQMLEVALTLPVSGDSITLSGNVIGVEADQSGVSQAVMRMVERDSMDWLLVEQLLSQDEAVRHRTTK
ncbi:MAG: GGDEF domain-containing protein [Candidatus Latescibacteria bacterium]|nr:GGDEF domain-containing protein [Candidatus Latescibacterota bacterium]